MGRLHELDACFLSGFGPFAHGLPPGAVDMHGIIDARDPRDRDEVMLPGVVFRELDGSIVGLDVVDDGELTALRANDRHVRFDSASVLHARLRARTMPRPRRALLATRTQPAVMAWRCRSHWRNLACVALRVHGETFADSPNRVRAARSKTCSGSCNDGRDGTGTRHRGAAWWRVAALSAIMDSAVSFSAGERNDQRLRASFALCEQRYRDLDRLAPDAVNEKR